MLRSGLGWGFLTDTHVTEGIAHMMKESLGAGKAMPPAALLPAHACPAVFFHALLCAVRRCFVDCFSISQAMRSDIIARC